NSAEPWQDYDWRAEDVQSTHDQLARFWRRAQSVIDADVPAEAPNLERIDRWLLSKLQGVIRDVTESMEGFSTRHASQDAFYRLDEYLRWYRKRTDVNRPGARWVQREILRARLRLLSPVIPFMTNELHEQLTGIPAEDATWPEPDPELESDLIEVEERLIDELHHDVRDIVEVTGTDPDRIQLFTAAPWKHRVFDEIVETGTDLGEVMSRLMQHESLRERGDAVNELADDLLEEVRERDEGELASLQEVDEERVYERATGFLAGEFDATVEVVPEVDASAEKAGQAKPFRPAILLE
ncbi:MAG: class I tRNA ligase family protein, partial [Halodesulfurarchaeum sp.]